MQGLTPQGVVGAPRNAEGNGKLRSVLHPVRRHQGHAEPLTRIENELFGGLKLSVILAVVGAVVGEFSGANVGLGYLINLARGVLDTPLMFVAVFALVAIAQVLYLLVALLESRLLRWQA